MTSSVPFSRLLSQAVDSRKELLNRFLAEGTDSYRLFHGTNEGRPGLTLDRYGPCLLLQVFYGELNDEELDCAQQLARQLGLKLLVWQRDLNQVRRGLPLEGDMSAFICREQGQFFFASEIMRGLDPYFFLDFRAGRRWLRANVQEGQTLLNLFSYTCTAGIAAGRGQSTNVDFGRWCLKVGWRNAELNGLTEDQFITWNEDVLAVLRQTSGLGIKGRASRRSYLQVPACRFDYVVLDPPTVSKSAFGKVDIVNDYPALLKPALLSLKAGGRLLAVNHASKVSRSEWQRMAERTAQKCGVSLSGWQDLEPEKDFPSQDGEQPLKISVISVC